MSSDDPKPTLTLVERLFGLVEARHVKMAVVAAGNFAAFADTFAAFADKLPRSISYVGESLRVPAVVNVRLVDSAVRASVALQDAAKAHQRLALAQQIQALLGVGEISLDEATGQAIGEMLKAAVQKIVDLDK